MKHKKIKQYWLMLNIIFLFMYTLTLLPYFISIPIRPPKLLVCLPLLLSYYLTLKTKDIGSLLHQSNLYCMIIFITFPHHAFLFPFFIISYFNVGSHVIANRKKYENQWFCDIMCQSMRYKQIGCFIAYTLEVVSCFFAVVFYVFGYANLIMVAAYIGCIYTEYKKNDIMKKATHNAIDFARLNIKHFEIVVEYCNVLKNAITKSKVPIKGSYTKKKCVKNE